MNLIVSMPLFIKKGVGALKFPEAFKRAPQQVHIGCDSMYFSPNPKAKNEPLFLVCSGSFYYNCNHEVQPNILGMFVNKQSTNIVKFSKVYTITSAQESLEIEIVDFDNNRKDVSCFAVFHLEGLVSNKFLTL